MKCPFCEIIEEKRDILYEDEDIVAVIKDTALTPGQVTIFPKEHHTILEMVPDKVLEKCSVLANKVGMAVFEGLGVQGTNVLVQNGLGAGQKVPHFSIDIIPRKENDGLDLLWEPQQMPEDELEVMFSKLKESEKEMKEAKEEKASETEEEMTDDNYMILNLKKIP